MKAQSRPTLLSISGSNFQSFRKPFKVDFPANGLILLQGKNNDTDGSSASGKSNFTRAINFALGSCSVPATKLETWDGDGSFGVTLKVGFQDGKTVEISRGKKFRLIENEVEFSGSAAQKEEKLRSVFGLSPELQQLLTYRGQRKPGLFLSMTDSEKKEFLTQLLDLAPFEKAQDDGEAKIKALEDSAQKIREPLAVLTGRVAELEVGLNPDDVALVVKEAKDIYDKARLEVQALEQFREQERAKWERQVAAVKESFKSALDVATQDLAYREVPLRQTEGTSPELLSLENLLQATKSRLTSLKAKDAQTVAEIKQQTAALQKQIVDCNRRAAGISTLLREQDRLAAELAKLDSAVCPTCERTWNDAVEHRKKVVAGLKDTEEALRLAAEAKFQIPTLQEQAEKLSSSFVPNPMVAELEGMAAQISSDMAAERQRLTGEQALLNAEHQKQVAQAQAALADVKSAISAATLKVKTEAQAAIRDLDSVLAEKEKAAGELQRALFTAEGNLRACRARHDSLAKAKTEMAALQAKHEAIMAEWGEEKDFLHAIGREGFLGSIFDEVLEEISAEANDVLASVANIRHCSIRFVSERVTEKGTVKRAIVPRVSLRGREVSIKDEISGGQLSGIELAVDLALGAVISRRTGVCPGWLILDESFDGLDAISKEGCIEILQKYAADRLVLVVDHMAEVQGLFTHRLTVESQDGDSEIHPL